MPTPPAFSVDTFGDVRIAAATGTWNVAMLSADPARVAALARAVDAAAADPGLLWDLTDLEGIDHVGALIFWRAWGRRVGPRVSVTQDQRRVFHNLAQIPPPGAEVFGTDWLKLLDRAGRVVIGATVHIVRIVGLFGQVLIDLWRFIRKPQRGPWREIGANMARAGTQALPITALVGFLIGVVLSYLSAQQLKAFGAGVFIVDLLGVAIIRELGPVLAAILVAGRSGSAMTAQIGVMRVTEELDALHVMGIPRGFRLVLPKVLALAFVMPLLIVWTDILALFGGMLAARAQLGMELRFFFEQLPHVVRIENYWLGLGKGVVFGGLIALVACHFGLRVAPNTESLARSTTQSVVTAITLVIVVDALFAILFQNFGL